MEKKETGVHLWAGLDSDGHAGLWLGQRHTDGGFGDHGLYCRCWDLHRHYMQREVDLLKSLKKKIALIFPCIGNMINGGISFKPCIYYNYDNKCLFDGGGFAYWVAMIPN